MSSRSRVRGEGRRTTPLHPHPPPRDAAIHRRRINSLSAPTRDAQPVSGLVFRVRHSSAGETRRFDRSRISETLRSARRVDNESRGAGMHRAPTACPSFAGQRPVRTSARVSVRRASSRAPSSARRRSVVAD